MLKAVWGMKAGASDIPASLRRDRKRKMFMQYLFRDGLQKPGWGPLYIRSLTKSYVRNYDIELETRVDLQDDTLLSVDVTVGAFTFTSAAGKLEASNGALATHRPDGIRISPSSIAHARQ
jgi:hypothetical protein